MLAVSTKDCGSFRSGSNPEIGTKKGRTNMFWYIKEETWGHSNLYGPFDSKLEAEQYKNQLPHSFGVYKVFSCKDLLQLV